MRHFNIRASHDLTEVDIFGQIGESFFEDGNTLDSVRAEITGMDTPITFNVASLGGDAFEGLAIHDLIKAHKHPTTVNVVGATASAGAVIAAAGDTVNISENSLFLVHKARTVAAGTAKDLQDTIDMMNQVDNRMKSVFTARTGMDAEALDVLLDEDRFMDAEEALSLGFVDAISKPVKVAASVDINKVMASSYLTDEQKELLKTNQILTKMELSEDSKSWFTTAIEAAVSKFKPAAEVVEVVEEVTAPVEAVVDTAAIEAAAELEALTAKVEALKAEAAALEASKGATEVEVVAEADPTPETDTAKDPWSAFASAYVERPSLAHKISK